MPNYICRHCDANNPEQGKCIMCQKPLGNLRDAYYDALWATVALILLWIICSVLLGMQHPVIAALFGGVVSFCTTYFSGGRGILYQLIATAFTVVGIVAADSFVTLVSLHLMGDYNLFTINFHEHILSVMKWSALHDDYTIYFYLFGVFGGFFIWRE